MPFTPITNACQAEIRMQWDNQRVALTLGFVKQTAITVPELTTLANLLSNWWTSQARNQISSAVTLREVYVRDLTTIGSPSYTSILGAGTAGLATGGSAFPSNVSLAISFRTAGRGRANRGRNFWVGLRSSMFASANNVTSGVANAIIGYYARFLPAGGHDPTPFRWCVLSRQLDGVPQGRAVPITQVLVVDTVVDSMRKRLPGRGL